MGCFAVWSGGLPHNTLPCCAHSVSTGWQTATPLTAENHWVFGIVPRFIINQCLMDEHM